MKVQNPFLPDFDVANPMPEALYSAHDFKDPRYLLTHFLMGEIYLKVSNISVFTEMINKVNKGEIPTWNWSGNVFSLTIDQASCILTDFEAEANENIINTVTMSHAEFLNVMQEWHNYVARFNLSTY